MRSVYNDIDISRRSSIRWCYIQNLRKYFDSIKYIARSYSASGQKYGIVAANTVSITWSSTNFQTMENLKVKFNSMSAKCTEISGVSTRVTKMEYSASLQPPYGSYMIIWQQILLTIQHQGVAYGKTFKFGIL